MRPTFLLLLAATSMVLHPLPTMSEARPNDLPMAAVIGGPPAIRIADKANGDITRAEWTAATAVKLAGCVADARVTGMTVCIKDCTGKNATLTVTSGTFSKEMKTMIANLPDGTPFTVKVEVKDDRGKSWEVPDASFTLVR